MEEIWKDIAGYEGLYQVSNLGRVKSLSRKVSFGWSWRCTPEKVLSPGKVNGRYYHVLLFDKDHKRKDCLVHRLVAEAFIPNPDNLPCVNHKDENIWNNQVSNLEWCSVEYNNNYGTLRERMAKKQSMPIIQYSIDGAFIKKWSSLAEAGRQMKLSPGHLSNCCNGKTKTAGGFIWKYAV